MTNRVTPRPKGIDELLAYPQVKGLVTLGAAGIATEAASLVTVHTGHARDSYKSTKAENTGDRVVASAYTDDPAGHMIEFGSVNNVAEAPLRRAAEASGLRTHPAPKGA